MARAVMPVERGGFDAGKGNQWGGWWPLIYTIFSFTLQKRCSYVKILDKKKRNGKNSIEALLEMQNLEMEIKFLVMLGT